MIFVDTSFWVALRNKRDARHAEAVRLLGEYADRSLVTSNHVRGETWTFLSPTRSRSTGLHRLRFRELRR